MCYERQHLKSFTNIFKLRSLCYDKKRTALLAGLSGNTTSILHNKYHVYLYIIKYIRYTCNYNWLLSWVFSYYGGWFVPCRTFAARGVRRKHDHMTKSPLIFVFSLRVRQSCYCWTQIENMKIRHGTNRPPYLTAVIFIESYTVVFLFNYCCFMLLKLRLTSVYLL
jgi:hypothetical protein